MLSYPSLRSGEGLSRKVVAFTQRLSLFLDYYNDHSQVLLSQIDISMERTPVLAMRQLYLRLLRLDRDDRTYDHLRQRGLRTHVSPPSASELSVRFSVRLAPLITKIRWRRTDSGAWILERSILLKRSRGPMISGVCDNSYCARTPARPACSITCSGNQKGICEEKEAGKEGEWLTCRPETRT